MGGEAAGVPVPISITVIIQAAADALSAQNLFLWFRGASKYNPLLSEGLYCVTAPPTLSQWKGGTGWGSGTQLPPSWPPPRCLTLPLSGACSSVKWAVAAGSEIPQLYNFPVYLGTRVARKGQDTQLKLNFR